jgi:UDP-N-acetylglucosamine 2-epimerase (non-hydrolysing)
MSCDLLLIAGTRPEALKLLPLASPLRLRTAWCWTSQQAELPPEAARLRWQQLAAPAHPLRRRELQQSLTSTIGAHIQRIRPRATLVQGDTASAHAGARASADAGIPVIHLEAGLRSADLRSPFPEEGYRRAIARLARLHLAPSARAAAQLRTEGITAEHIVVVGSTAIDGLRAQAPTRPSTSLDLLVDVHRRENSGRALERLALALRALARSGWRIGVAAHPNHAWEQRWTEVLGAGAGVRRLPPLDRGQWLGLARAARGVLSDSGGAAEELPYLGVPLLIYRRRCERMEAIESGHARQLLPDATSALDAQIERALDQRQWPAPWPLAADSPYGDGHAGARAAAAIEDWLCAVPASPLAAGHA